MSGIPRQQDSYCVGNVVEGSVSVRSQQIVKLLLSHGADPNRADGSACAQNVGKQRPAESAESAEGRAGTGKKSKRGGGEKQQRGGGKHGKHGKQRKRRGPLTPLHQACSLGAPMGVVRLLVAAGANTAALDRDGLTPCARAIAAGRDEDIHVLDSEGVDGCGDASAARARERRMFTRGGSAWDLGLVRTKGMYEAPLAALTSSRDAVKDMGAGVASSRDDAGDDEQRADAQRAEALRARVAKRKNHYRRVVLQVRKAKRDIWLTALNVKSKCGGNSRSH
jgi:hypothetical protein